MIQLFLNPNQKGLAVILIFLGLLALCTPGYSQGEAELKNGISKAIKHCMRAAGAHVLSRKWEARRDLATEIFEASMIYEQDPYLLTGIFYSESTFDHMAKGAIGEHGIGQVHNTAYQMCKKHGFNMKERSDQINCTAWLLQGFDKKCKSKKRALTAYVGWGRCKTKRVRKQWQVKHRLNLAQKLRKIGEKPDPPSLDLDK